ncbi:MAG: ABC transporter substrate-binding protein [Promethearchaeota archaeon]|jgi:ABC-type transport system substrate-binding protein
MKKSYILMMFSILVSFSVIISSNYTMLNKNNIYFNRTFNANEIRLSDVPPLIFGIYHLPHDIDPHYAWDPYSLNIIEQACEALFTYNYSDAYSTIIPHLASDYGTWSIDGLNYTVSVHQNVTFHDGTPFNASAIQWNYNRLSYLMNITGTLPAFEPTSQFKVVYLWPDDTPIINRTEIVDTFTIRYVLNRPYAALEGLLCFSGSFMLSPTSTDPVNRIETTTGNLVGTGPYVYENYITDVEVTFQAYNNYWKANPEINSLVFTIYDNSIELNNALLNGDIDVLMNPLPSYLDFFNSSPNISVIDQEKGSWTSYYIGMNNNHINQTFREAISYAIDYDYIINTYKNGSAERLKSPVPKGVLYSNYSLNVPYLNLSHARQVMKSMGFGVGFTTETEWETATFATFNVTYMNVSSVYSSWALLLMNNLSKIGIQIEDAGLETWVDYILMLMNEPPYSRDMLQLFMIGWVPDFNDPSQLFNVLFNNSTSSNLFNFAQYNGGYGGFEPYDKDNDVQLLMESALEITDKDERKQIYNKIQELIVERDFPVAWLFTPKVYMAYNNKLDGLQEHTFCNVDENDKASLKGDIIYLTWKSIPTNGGSGPSIPGYSPMIFSIIFLAYVTIILRKNKKTKSN